MERVKLVKITQEVMLFVGSAATIAGLVWAFIADLPNVSTPPVTPEAFPSKEFEVGCIETACGLLATVDYPRMAFQRVLILGPTGVESVRTTLPK